MKKNKYPISLTGQKCVGPCVKANTTIIHPQTLNYINKQNVDYCPINPIYDKNLIKKHNKIFKLNEDPRLNKIIAPCKNTTNDTNNDNKFLIPEININCLNFLELFYNINSIEDTLKYIKEHSNIPKNTKIRLINCTWEAFCSNKNNITDNFVKFYYNYIKNKWINYFYEKLKVYLGNKKKKLSC
jgi:hypothetical protein